MKSRLRLRKSSTKVYRRLQDGPVLPPWVRFVPYALGLMVFVFVSFQLFADKDTTISDLERSRLDSELSRTGGIILDPATPTSVQQQTQPTSPVDPSNPAPTGPILSGSDPATPPSTQTPLPTADSTTATDLTVGLTTKTGLVVQVPADALSMARAATLARFTGDFEAVQLGSSVSVPWLPRTWPDPYVGDPVVSSVGDGVFVLAFRVDPDRSGVEPLREILTAVSYVPGQGWVWLGA